MTAEKVSGPFLHVLQLDHGQAGERAKRVLTPFLPHRDERVTSESGLFLSLDGVDGTGKSTQCHLLAQWLRQRGHTVTECFEPGGTAIGRQIRELVLDARQNMVVACEMFLFMASRAQLTTEVIRPALEQGHTLISDRYLLSTVVYQGHAGGLDVDQLWSVGRLATGGLEPDLTIVLDLPVDEALRRRKQTADRVEGRELTYHQRVRDGFLAEARRRPEHIKVVDAGPPVAAVQEAICYEVSNVLAARARS
jgi:dTMP kinase